MWSVAAVWMLLAAVPAAHAERTIFECSGMQRAFNRATNSKLPATAYTRVFAFDEGTNAVLEYMNQTWTVLDAAAEVDQSDISARYSRDYPDGRVDVIFEYNRVNNDLIYIMDIDEKPGEFFDAHCLVGSAKHD